MTAERPAYARRLRAARLHRQYTIRQLHEESGVTERTLYNWEAGRHSPNEQHLFEVARALNVSALWLLEGIGPNPLAV